MNNEPPPAELRGIYPDGTIKEKLQIPLSHIKRKVRSIRHAKTKRGK